MGEGYTRVNKIFSGRSRVCRMLAWHIRLILVPEIRIPTAIPKAPYGGSGALQGVPYNTAQQ